MNVGAVIPPHRLYSARAPIHPKRPYGLTRPVVPPDGSFLFSMLFVPELFSFQRLYASGRAPFFPNRRRKNFPSSAQRRHAAMRLDGACVE